MFISGIYCDFVPVISGFHVNIVQNLVILFKGSLKLVAYCCKCLFITSTIYILLMMCCNVFTLQTIVRYDTKQNIVHFIK